LANVLLPDADFSLEENKEMFCRLPFLNEHFASGQSPFFSLLDANLIFILKFRKEGDDSKRPFRWRLGVNFFTIAATTLF
jgi:hypothetical protein